MSRSTHSWYSVCSGKWPCINVIFCCCHINPYFGGISNNCRASISSKFIWDQALITSPTSLNPNLNKQLNWEHNLSFPNQHNSWKAMSDSFCKELQSSVLDHGFHTYHRSVSCHKTTEYWTHEEWWILIRIWSLV